ncbi:MAG: hypothetical protein EOP42_00855 [Sphingobacteriaceae bacterium]|nr:MAG: hypothetical protein EOP42_00855 [Sphingobacteriaceae bacterium]
MADKDLLGIIADMLRKLDQHSQELKVQGNRLEIQSEVLKKQGEVLTAFMEGALKQFDQQLLINDKIVDRLEVLENRLN